MRRLYFAVALLVFLALLVLPQAASAKGAEPIRIVAPSGKVGWIRGAAADAWWKDFDTSHAGSCVCNSPTEAAKFMYRLVRLWGPSVVHSDGSWPTAMLVQGGHTIPMLYYPASGAARPYLLAPGERGNHIQWDVWHVVTPRMQTLMTAALKNGSVTTATGSAEFPTGWLVGGLGAALLISLILGARRRLRVPERLAAQLSHSRHRVSPR